MKRNMIKMLTVAAAIGLTAVPVRATNVAIELALLVDVSGSIDATEYALQRQGYVNAFNSAAVQSAIATIVSQTGMGIAVTYIEWSGGTQQSTEVGWTLINNAATASAFATAIGNATRDFSGNTAPGSALNYAYPLFTGNGFESEANGLQIIDVSGDGAENEGANTATARNSALAAGIDRINGLAIGDATLQAWYAANIQGGANSFTYVANDFGDFQQAIEAKLYREITGRVPEGGPGLALFGLTMAGMAAWRRRKA